MKCEVCIEADCHVFSKLVQECFYRKFEAEAFSWRDIDAHGDSPALEFSEIPLKT